MINTLRHIPVILLCAFALLACGIQKPANQNQVSKGDSDSQQQQMEQMEPKFLYLAAQNALKDGNRELASQLLSALVTKDPDSIVPHIQLAELLLQLGHTEEAEKQIALLLKKNLQKDDHEKLLLSQARLSVSKNEQARALELLDELFKENPINLRGRELQALILSDQNRLAEALTAINESIQVEEIAELRLLQAQLLLKQHENRAAEVALQRIRKLVPDNDTAVLMQSSIALQENDRGKAEELLRDFLNEYPNAMRVGHALGKIMVQDNRIAEAIIIYRDIASRSGDSPEILKTLGMLYFRYNDFEGAEQTFRKLLNTQPDDHNRFFLAASLEALKRPDEAKEIYESINPEGTMGNDAQVRLAGIDFREGNLREALSLLNHLLKTDPQHTEAQLIRSAIRLANGQYKLLLKETEAMLSMDKVHPQLLFNRAVAFDHLKSYDQLEAVLTRLLKSNPEHSEAMNFLGYSYATQGIHLDKAELLINQALSLKPDDGYYLDSLAWVYYQRNEYDKALETQKKAIAKIGDDPVMYEHLGDMLWKTGDFPAARNAWKKSIELKADTPEKLRAKIANGLENDR
ncbi:putative conserved protein HemY, contains two TPR repeats [Mariprofundus aestuarium]|uniref:Putative conserved protein HemY, contains two TPR repeats n=1 Tax=Mariprofundus aestuarium TaxID=1921086 RepID=A0A2K8KZC6_MARES|nr:tetratricopeptide repeat protein [Mariprofundus aestuarium]ATX80337.1 putative conserved protein HemY, contains two TPR repeats [Mariprofundus aestuarium]